MLLHRYCNLTEWIHNLMVKDGSRKGLYSTPDNLTILTAHNYQTKPLFEVNMDFLGIEYVSVPITKSMKYAYTPKYEVYCDFIKSGKCTTDYILTADTNDVIFLDRPERIIKVFDSKNCDILFCSTLYKSPYVTFPKIKERIDSLRWDGIPEKERTYKYLNSGVFIAKTKSILDILERINFYIDDSIWKKPFLEYQRLAEKSENMNKYFDNYPHGVPCDQDIIRYIEPDYYPRIKIDLYDECIIRHSTGSLVDWLKNNMGVIYDS